MSLLHINFLFVVIALTNGQFIHEFHIAENSMIYKTVFNLKNLLISKNKIDANRSKDYKIFMNTVINNGLFILDSDSNLKVSKHIDREELCSPQVMIQMNKVCGSIHTCCQILEFQISHNNEETQSNFLRVYVDDENDNYPIFPVIHSPYYVVEENKPLGFRIPLPKAQDLDNATYSVAFYKLQTPFRLGNSSDFELVQTYKDGTPHLIVSSTLDREKTSLYSFTLIAVDGIEGNRNTGMTEITIKVKDINDNAPKFERPIYITTIRENVVVDPIFNILVTDEDEDDNGRIDLKLFTSGQDWINKIFTLDIIDHSIGKVQAQIRSINTLDYEQLYHSFEFKILAHDGGQTSLTSTATVRIQILNVNDMSPEIKFVRNGLQITGGFSVDEGTSSGKVLANIQVMDADSPTNQLQCSLTYPKNMLMIEESRLRHPANLYKQFSLKTTQNIDREANEPFLIDSKVTVFIQCEDNDNEIPLNTNASVYIMINDINDNAPIFSQTMYYGQIEENINNIEVTMLTAIHATDKDMHLNGKVSYHLVDFQNKSHITYFRIESQSGKLFNSQSFDFEKQSVYNFLVVATDQGSPQRLSSSATIIIRIKDQNDNAPQFSQNHFSFSVYENIEIGYVIGQINATDKDFLPENKDIKFYIKADSQNRPSKLITVDPLSGYIRTRHPIDREKIPTITFVVEVKNPSRIINDVIQEAMVVITVRDLNDSPPTFRLIDPAKSRLIISIEMLQQGPVCEQIPFIIEDADDNGGVNPCCTVKLKHDYNGLLSLSDDSQTIICINQAPKLLRSLQVTLVASDRQGNNSMQAEETFTIIFKNDPNGMGNSKNQPPSSKIHRPDQAKDDIRQITMIIILASLAGLFIMVILMVLIITIKKCERFNANHDSCVLEKNNQSDSQAMLDRNCIIQKNDLEASSFNDIMTSSPINYYEGMHMMPSNKSLNSPCNIKYPGEMEFSLKEDYMSPLDRYTKYQVIDKPDETYQALKSKCNRLDHYDSIIRTAPVKAPLLTNNNQTSFNETLSNTKPSSTSQINLVSLNDRQSHSTIRSNQTSFV